MTVIYQCILISNWQSSNWINQPKTENREKRNLGVVHLKEARINLVLGERMDYAKIFCNFCCADYSWQPFVKCS